MSMAIKFEPIGEYHLLRFTDEMVREVVFRSCTKKFDQCNLIEYYNRIREIKDNETASSKTIEAFLKTVESAMILQNSLTLSYKEFTHIVASNLLGFEHCIIQSDFYEQKRIIKNQKSIISYLQSLTDHYSRLLSVRVDLSYKAAYREFNPIDIFDIHITSLLEKARKKSGCFDGLQGYVWTLEQGCKKGYHCHLLLLFDGSKYQNDWLKANQVGEYWVKKTQGMGQYFNCSDATYKRQFEKSGTLGVGMVKRGDVIRQRNLINVACYLAKPDKLSQQLLMTPARMRTFGRGIYKTKRRRGTGI